MKHTYALLILAVAVANLTIASASIPVYHVLQEVVKTTTDLTSVDIDSDGIIDTAELLFGTNVIPASGSVGIGTTNPTQALDVAGYVKGRTGFCIGDDCIAAWPAGGGAESDPQVGTLVAGKWCRTDGNAVQCDRDPPAAGFTNMQVFSSPGTYSWTVPAGVTSVMVEVWGGGGAGGSAAILSSDRGGGLIVTVYMGGAGGGGGGYGKDIFTVSPGTTYSVIAGAGGTSASPSGGMSSFGNLISASGGTGGGSGMYATGGTGGTSQARISIAGRNGQFGFIVGGDGGSVGNGGAGGAGGYGSSIAGGDGFILASISGNAPGGGGGGGGPTAANGAHGRVIVYW